MSTCTSVFLFIWNIIIKTSKNREGIGNVIGIEIWDENNKCYHIVKRDWVHYKIYFKTKNGRIYNYLKINCEDFNKKLHQCAYKNFHDPLEKIISDNYPFTEFNLVIRDIIKIE